MKSKTSFINTGILRNDIKRFTWLGVAYLLGLFLSVPLKILMMYGRPEEVKQYYDAYTYSRIFELNSSVLQIILLLIVPVLAGLLLFRYLQAGSASDMEHTLPIKRETMYTTHVLAGFSLLFIPLTVTALFSGLLISGLNIEGVDSRTILSWLGLNTLMVLLLFMSSAATGMFTGMSTVQGALAYILLLLPTGFSELILHNLGPYVYGMAFDYYNHWLSSLSPLLRIMGAALQPVEVVVYLLSSIALYLLGRYAYRRRPIEKAGEAMTFQALKPVFKYGVTFCSMMLLGSYFKITQDSMAWTYFGYFLGSVLAYYLIEILLSKSLYVFNWQRFKGYGVYSLFIIILIILLPYSMNGYEKRLPPLDAIEGIYMDSSFYLLINREENLPAIEVEMAAENDPVYTGKENIKNIYTLHHAIVDNLAMEKKADLENSQRMDQLSICLAYELQDGSRMYRQYRIDRFNYARYLKPIYESLEYKRNNYDICRIDPSDADLLKINCFYGDKEVVINDPQLIQQAIAILKKDIYAQSYEEMMESKPPWATITAIGDYDRCVGLRWEKTYRHFEQWLKDNGYYRQARLIPGEDITYVLVNYEPDYDSARREKIESRQAIAEMESKPGVLKITDAQKMETCLRSCRDSYEKEAKYELLFVLKNGNSMAGSFTKEEAPEFVKEHFNR